MGGAACQNYSHVWGNKGGGSGGPRGGGGLARRIGIGSARDGSARGGLQNEADILACLDDGTLGAASLDVFAEEPLPPDSRFWTHNNVVLTPHNAADTDPDEISKYVAQQIERFEAGGALENVVDPARGY